VTLASVFGTNLFHYQPDGVIEFYESYSAVREIYEQAAEWTGFDVEALLHQRGFEHDPQLRLQAGSVALAAAQLGIHDVLAEKGIRPHVVGGLSLGAMVSSCVAGSLGRRELVELLVTSQHLPESAEEDRAEAVASAFLPLDFDPDFYYGEQREGVFLGSDFGRDVTESCRVILLSGYRDALEKLASEVPPGQVVVNDEAGVAVHSPLRREAADLTERQVAGIDFRDPDMPLCSCLEERTLGSAGEVAELFVRNVVEPVSTVHLTGGMQRHGAQLGLVIGPSQIRDLLKFPFPVVYVDSPKAIAEAVAAIFELGVELPED
jgi:[acyl-carrier-protein] S-malonyltransferase